MADGFHDYPCSTALNGPGEREGSGCTPRGGHRIRAIIGRGELENTILLVDDRLGRCGLVSYMTNIQIAIGFLDAYYGFVVTRVGSIVVGR